MELSEQDIRTYVLYKAIRIFKVVENININQSTRSITGIWDQLRDQYLNFLSNFCNQLLQNLNVNPIIGRELMERYDIDTDEINDLVNSYIHQFANQYNIEFNQAFPLPQAPVVNVIDKFEVSCFNNQCGICMEELESGIQTIQYSCHHCFHETCILSWLSRSNTCPICRLEQNIYYRSDRFTQR